MTPQEGEVSPLFLQLVVAEFQSVSQNSNVSKITTVFCETDQNFATVMIDWSRGTRYLVLQKSGNF